MSNSAAQKASLNEESKEEVIKFEKIRPKVKKSRTIKIELNYQENNALEPYYRKNNEDFPDNASMS